QLPAESDRLFGRQRLVAQSEPAEARIDEGLQPLRDLCWRGYCHHPAALLGDLLELGFRVSSVLDQDREGAHQEPHRRRVTALRFAVPEEDVPLVLQRVDRSTEEVAHIAMPRQDAKGALLAAASNEDLRAAGLHRAWNVKRAIDPVVLAFERGPVL